MALAAETSYQPEKLTANHSHQTSLAWWIKLVKGNGDFYLELFFVALETCFGFPGLLKLLPPHMAGDPLFIFATIAGGSFFAIINVSLGYFVGIKKAIACAALKIYQQQVYQIQTSDSEEVCRNHNAIYAETVAKSDAAIEHFEQDIAWLDVQIAKLDWTLKSDRTRSYSSNLYSYPNSLQAQDVHPKNGDS
jgi:hypothetical protein